MGNIAEKDTAYEQLRIIESLNEHLLSLLKEKANDAPELTWRCA
jgi:hypothetical protein